MGNQARTDPGTTVISTSTRNFPNRLGQDTKVYLGSAELAAIAAITGRIPTVEEYMSHMKKISSNAEDTYKYLKFDKMPNFVENASKVVVSDDMKNAARCLECDCPLAQ